jgi:predicted nucleic acid-binding protein
MRIVDTNVVAYLLIAGDATPQAQALWRADPDWRSDSFFRIEFSNLLATQVRAKALTLTQAVALLERALAIVTATAELSHADVLRLAASLGVSAYDARFLATAQATGTRLITQDSRLRKAAPALTQSITEALAA